jgi:hypothetical protein
MHDWQVGTVATLALFVAEVFVAEFGLGCAGFGALGGIREPLQHGSERPPTTPPARS